MITAALIPARGGSVRVPNKNLQKIGGLTMVERKVRQLQMADLVDKIYVGSDSPEILAVAEKAGAIAIHRDPLACDESVSPANVMIGDFSSRIEADVAVWAHCTNPFIYGHHYDGALRRFFEARGEGHDSLLSVFRVQSHMWSKFGFPVNYNPYAKRHALSKELEPVFFQDGAIFIQPLSGFRSNSYFFGNKPVLHEIDFPYCFDVNTPQELDFAQLISASVDATEGFVV